MPPASAKEGLKVRTGISILMSLPLYVGCQPKIAPKSPLCILGSWVLGFEGDPYSPFSPRADNPRLLPKVLCASWVLGFLGLRGIRGIRILISLIPPGADNPRLLSKSCSQKNQSQWGGGGVPYIYIYMAGPLPIPRCVCIYIYIYIHMYNTSVPGSA